MNYTTIDHFILPRVPTATFIQRHVEQRLRVVDGMKEETKIYAIHPRVGWRDWQPVLMSHTHGSIASGPAA